jgi:hypothetical protein
MLDREGFFQVLDMAYNAGKLQQAYMILVCGRRQRTLTRLPASPLAECYTRQYE